jgi:hypothetical protein
LVDFFFFAAVVVAELPDAGAALDSCWLGVLLAALAGCADAEHAQTNDARNSDAAIGSLLIFLRFSSLPRAEGFGERSVRRGSIPYYGDFPRGLKPGHP